ncbi:hypothetical protein K2F54_18720 [Cryobacterium sp. 1639]|uniref:hypothetical protein n=1 Tax=Cryobacterium inferilacus TaxID=2866629 RepID=UPI001C72C428|nr:hypothetical protein [Cryobacterium sp. 1639]MBX0301999.1 hypothetical protein [Cryobacterium sp. 1639]
MILLSPTDPSIPIAWDAGSTPGTDISIRVGADVGPSAFIIRTMERTGQRMNEAGQVTGVVDDARTMAELAVREALLVMLDQTYSRDSLAIRMEEIAEEARVVDWSEWEFTQIVVDGVGFALRVRNQQPSGFVAIADLGTVVVTMRGKELPTDRRFTLHRRL